MVFRYSSVVKKGRWMCIELRIEYAWKIYELYNISEQY